VGSYIISQNLGISVKIDDLILDVMSHL